MRKVTGVLTTIFLSFWMDKRAETNSADPDLRQCLERRTLIKVCTLSFELHFKRLYSMNLVKTLCSNFKVRC